jgi:AcrR family transcriptional regulator
MGDRGATRRRGAALEDALLEAAWTELAAAGYSNFTFEAVVKRAGTSRPVLYRRWPTRASLASAAIARHVKHNALIVPDLGNVRDELRLLLRKFADRSPPKLLRLLFEMSDDMSAENMSFKDERFRLNPLNQVVERAIRRGEIDARRLTPRVLSTPLGLVLHEVVVTGRQISDESIGEIVDQVFLPLVAPVDANDSAG